MKQLTKLQRPGPSGFRQEDFKFSVKKSILSSCAMDQNHLNNFVRGPTKDHSCKVWSKSNQWFRRSCHLKKLFSDTWMHGRWTKCDHKSSPCHYVTGEQKAVHQVQHNTIIAPDKAFF